MSSSINLLVFVLAILSITVVQADPCAKFMTCGLCIGNTLKCIWCQDQNHTEARCATSSLVLKPSSKPWCLSPMNPQTQKPIITKNDEFRSKKAGRSTIQLKPQQMFIKARPGDTVAFEVYYRPAEDYPIDIYYLFDNSHTMKPHKDKLVQQARDMKKELEKRSNNVRFGAGSFVEKLAMPYANEEMGHKLNTFNNHVSLTDDIDKFVEIVEKVAHTSNYDDPESGLDGLMQVMVCNKEINWRENARRMIIYLTDATYHSAGDGKIVGAYKPNDMQCHLVPPPTPGYKYISHMYEKNASLTYDYPSVSQISKVASEGKFSIFFTTLKKVSEEYKALAGSIKKAHYFELKEINNSSDSGSNLVEFISEEYQKLVRTLTFDEDVPPYVEVTVNCNQTSSCPIGYNESLTINGKIHVKSCPHEDKTKDIIKIWPSSLEETLNFDIKVLCHCECEREGKKNSMNCNYNGTYQCGICKCNHNRYGKTCQCEGTSTEERDNELCKASANDTNVCSGRGTCLCGGKCECWSGYDGAQCQFRMDECPTFENKVCGNQGKCEENVCKCFTGYTRFDCACTTATDMCVGANSEICSGNGNCKCGQCECAKFDKRNNLYRGKFCDSCDTCIEDRCKELEDYVECNFDVDQSKCDKTFHVKNHRTIEIKNLTEMNGWAGNRCVKTLDDKSGIVFKYLDGNNSTTIWIQKEKELPPEINKLMAFGTAIGVILFIGILTLIAWKILVDIHDSREYRKFVEESTSAGFEVSENPLYNPPQISINNPAYMG